MATNSPIARRIIVKFPNQVGLNYGLGNEQILVQRKIGDWGEILNKYPNIPIELKPLIDGLPPSKIKELADKVPQSKQANDPFSYFSISCPPGVDPTAILNIVSRWPVKAYLEELPAEIPKNSTSGSVPSHVTQGYLEPAIGIDARYAHSLGPPGQGAGVMFIDMEQGWEHDPHTKKISHNDLPLDIPLLSGVNETNFFHGTAVLGVVAARGISTSCRGVAPLASVNCVSMFRAAAGSIFRFPNIAEAIKSATSSFLDAGNLGVLLIEAQLNDQGVFLPVEVESDKFDAIEEATELGIVVVEAAGNGGRNLDDIIIKDSGAILVGGGTSSSPFKRVGGSNWSEKNNRVHCFAWGENVLTLSNFGSNGVMTFDGTSSAASIIAGAAIIVQSVAQHRFGVRLKPEQVRTLLQFGTASHKNEVGVMPNLRQILDVEIGKLINMPK